MFDEDVKTKEQRFEAARTVFEAAVSSPAYCQWFDRACEDYDYYEGNQWGHLTEEEKEYMAARKMTPVTVNLIKPKIDNITGAEIQTRTKFKYVARSLDNVERIRAETLTDVAYWLQDKNDSSYLMSMAAFDARICGIGWHTFDVQGKMIGDDIPSPLEMVWDVRDTTRDLSRQGFFARCRWYPLSEVLADPDYKDVADKLKEQAGTGSIGFGGKFGDGLGNRMLLRQRGGYFCKELSEVLIVKLYYREPAKFYVTHTKDKQIVRGFDRSEVEKMAERESDVSEYDGYKIREIHFCGTVNLLDRDHAYQLNPVRGDFIATPIVYQMGKLDRVPRGLVMQAKDPQRLYNKKNTKLNQLQGARQVIMDGDAVDDTQDVQLQASSPDGIIKKRKGYELRIEKHEFDIQTNTNSLIIHERQVEMALGIFNESMGVETNAQSGVAIQRRQTGTNRTHAPFLDTLRSAKKKIGKKLLLLIQQVMTDEMVLYITDDADRVKLVKLNQPAEDADGKPIKKADGSPLEKLDIAVGEYDVIIEETPDVASQGEEARESMTSLLNAGIDPMKWTPTLLETMGIPLTQRKRFETERQQLVNEQAAIKQLGGANAAQGPGGAVPAQQPITGGMNG